MSTVGAVLKTVKDNSGIEAAFDSRHLTNAAFTASVMYLADWTDLTRRLDWLVGTAVTSSPAHLEQQSSGSTGLVYDVQSSPKISRMSLRMQTG